MEDALSKIRPHTTSSLAHQKAPATLLRAIEATLDEQGAERTPTAYFATLLTTLDGTLKQGAPSLGEGELLPAELYLLSLVAAHVPAPVVRAQLPTVLGLTAPLFPALSAHAPVLRSQLGVYAAVFIALERAELEAPGVRQAFASALALVTDSRPKVRRRAAELVRDVLAEPPPPMSRHPYADRVGEWAATGLADAAASPVGKHKGKKTAEGDATDSAIHLLALLRMIMMTLPPSIWPSLTTHLLALPRLGNPYLSQSAYSLLSSLLTSPSPTTLDPETVDLTAQLPAILKAVLSSPPSRTDNTLAPAWLLLLGHTMRTLKLADPAACAAELPKAWKAAWAFLDNGDGTIRAAAAQSLDLLTQAFPPAFIMAALPDAATLAGAGADEPRSALGKIVLQTSRAFGQLGFASAVPELLAVVAALLSGLRTRASPDGPTATEILLGPLVDQIAALRTTRAFEHKEAADGVLGAALAVVGPHVLLARLPLHLEPADRAAGREPRAFLLPLLPAPHAGPLGHFVQYFVPLSERLFELQSAAEEAGRAAEAKVWSVLIGQVWAGLVGYCHVTPDLPEALTSEFAQLLTQLLYGQPDLRPAVLRALRAMVDSNVTAAASEEVDGERKTRAERNVVFLRTQAPSWLAVLFNVFGSVERDARAGVGDVIASWIGVAGDADVTGAYENVLGLFRTNLKRQDPGVAGAALDLLLLLLPRLPVANARGLLDALFDSGALAHPDGGLQKRAYKLGARVLERADVELDVAPLLERLEAAGEGVLGAAKRERLRMLGGAVARLPAGALGALPALVPEAVLGTKEPSEKARAEAFALVVAMGERMRAGGTIVRPGDGEDGGMGESVPASVGEFVTMLAGGLAGATPHMISATVTALSRVVFEFRDEIAAEMHDELLATLLVFLQSASREIVKAVLGYVKLALHALPAQIVRARLDVLVPALLRWAHPGKNAFKRTVRHVLERAMRKFGWEAVLAAAGEDEEGRKVLVNVKKRRERAKKKRTAAAQAEDEEDEAPRGKAAPVGDAFEDVLYGSESELGDSDDDDNEPAPAPRKGGRHTHGVRLRTDDDDPTDLLAGAARALATRGERRRAPGRDAQHFGTDAESGKMLIDDGDADEDDDAGAEEDVAGGAYREGLTGADGFSRGPDGRVKFHKDTKKRRRAAAEADDVEMGEPAPATPSPGKKAKRQEARLGAEFKAKRAGGDVKKGGVDPYAYMPLGQAAKKKGGKSGRIGIAGKR